MFKPLITVLCLAAAVSACARTVVDAYGRSVEIPDKIERFVCTGSGALRLASYLNALDHLSGIETSDLKYEKDARRDYAFVHHARFKKLPVIGKGGGTAYTAYPEALVEAKPDVILSGYAPDALEQLARETGIPVVSVRYLSINFIDESFSRALSIAAEVLDKKTRALEVLKLIEDNKADLEARRKSAGSKLTESVYTGAVTYNGAHGFAGTYSNFGPFTAVGAASISNRPEHEGYFEISLEEVLEAAPQVIFLDPANMTAVKREYAQKKKFFDSLPAVQKGRIYAMPSYNNYSTNISYALIDAYWAGTVLRPEAFADVNLKTKADEILKGLLGRAFFDEMQQYGQRYATLTLD